MGENFDAIIIFFLYQIQLLKYYKFVFFKTNFIFCTIQHHIINIIKEIPTYVIYLIKFNNKDIKKYN